MSGRQLRAVGVAVGVVALAAVCWAALAAFYTTDDHVFFWQDREQPFGWRFLSEPIYDHFSPWHRFNDHVAGALDGRHAWWPTPLLAIGWYVATVSAGWLLLREVTDDRRAPALVGALALAATPVFVRSGQWWAHAAQALPQLTFAFVALWGGVRYVRGGGRWTAAIAIAAYALALCGFIKALLVPIALLLLVGRPRRACLGLWAGLAAVTVSYLAIISGERYYRFVGDAAPPTSGEWLELVVLGFFGGTVPAALGASVGQDSGALGLLVILVADLAVLALAAFTVRRQPASWRLWAAGSLIGLMALAMSGSARLSEQGAAFIAFDPRYVAEGAIALQVAAAIALARVGLPRAPALVALAVIVVVLTVGSTVRQDREWVADQHRAWFDQLSTSADELRADGRRPSVIDAVTPGFLVAEPLIGLNLLSKVAPLREPDLSIGTAGGDPVFAQSDGRLVPVQLGAPRRTAASRPLPTCLDGDGPVQDRSLRLDVGTPPGDVGHVLELRFERLGRQLEASVQATSKTPNVVVGLPLPARLTTFPRVPAGRTSLRFLAAAGRLDTLTLTADPGRRVCVRAAAVRSFRLPQVTARRPR